MQEFSGWTGLFLVLPTLPPWLCTSPSRDLACFSTQWGWHHPYDWLKAIKYRWKCLCPNPEISTTCFLFVSFLFGHCHENMVTGPLVPGVQGMWKRPGLSPKPRLSPAKPHPGQLSPRQPQICEHRIMIFAFGYWVWSWYFYGEHCLIQPCFNPYGIHTWSLFNSGCSAVACTNPIPQVADIDPNKNIFFAMRSPPTHSRKETITGKQESSCGGG